ncbi:MAG: MaoC/PaaZ C-terminal domain-containing protein [Candidatus Hermodarchaeota archaeon]
MAPNISGLDLEAVGKKPTEAVFTYTTKDVILYALGIGAQIEELPFIYEKYSTGLKVFPSYATIASKRAFPRMGQIDFPRFIHGEELIRLYEPFAPAGEIKSTGQVKSIYDKGKAALINVSFIGMKAAGSKIFEVESSFFYLGAGGFGGERGPKTEELKPPEGTPPDFSIHFPTTKIQAALYRLSGDYNPLHIDPEAAKHGGQERPILHGLCTYGFATRAILHGACGGNISRFKEFKARFTNVVYPGDTLTTEGWKDDDRYIIQVRVGNRIVLSNAYAIIS